MKGIGSTANILQADLQVTPSCCTSHFLKKHIKGSIKALLRLTGSLVDNAGMWAELHPCHQCSSVAVLPRLLAVSLSIPPSSSTRHHGPLKSCSTAKFDSLVGSHVMLPVTLTARNPVCLRPVRQSALKQGTSERLGMQRWLLLCWSV